MSVQNNILSKEAYIDICIQDIITIHNGLHANSDSISRSIGFLYSKLNYRQL